jgi:hypothetical protein
MRVTALSAPVLLEFIAQWRTSIILHRQADTEAIVEDPWRDAWQKPQEA